MFVLKLFALPMVIGLVLFGNADHPGHDHEPVETYHIDAVHSTAIFRVHHRGAGMFYGRFNNIAGTVNMNAGIPTFEISIDVNSIDTNNERLDNHLKSPDFFNATEFPAMSFKSSSSKAIDETTYEVIGEITLHGVSKPLTVRMHKTGESENPRGKLIGFETEFVLTRSEFGMTYGVEGGSLGDETKVIVSLEAGD